MVMIFKFNQGFTKKKTGFTRIDLVLSLLMAFLFFYGCIKQQATQDMTASQSLSQPNVDKPNTEPVVAPVIVEFFDAGAFDRKLSSTLKQEPSEMTIDFIADVSINDIPERMDKWLSAVEKGGGVIDVQVDPAHLTRGIFSEVISLVIGAYDFIKKKMTYEPAQNYNAIVYYAQGTGKITKVIFSHK